MTELHDAEPIIFDPAAAVRLAVRFRATASVLRAQIPHRRAIATTAREEWRGAYATKFEQRMNVCASDAERLAEAMDTAAAQVDELARLAQEEQDRRTAAREWKVRHDKWQQHQDNRGVLGSVGDFFTGGEDEPEPPDLTPTATPNALITAPAQTGRD